MALTPRSRRSRTRPDRTLSAPRASSATDPRRRQRLEASGRRREPGPIPSAGHDAAVSTLDLVLDDFTRSWERGERPRAERYLDRLPGEDSAELIYHEYCLAEVSDLAPDPAEYLARFPDQADQLSRLFALHGVFSPSILRDWTEPTELPSSGDAIGPYQLLRELGRGAFARVFLAEQVDLDHRLVVLKVSTRSTAEPRLLARARHAHIVEVIRHASTDDAALHLVCMPFLGGATLASVLEARRGRRRKPRTGLDLLADLDRVAAPEYPRSELARPAREILAGLSYPQGIAWIVARVAEALDHAHRKGVAHGDLKPSNLLLTADASPLLLDFNLAVDWRTADAGESSAELGGTLVYMAPERLESIARGEGRAAPRADELHRADLYSMGLLLLEALTGRSPAVPDRRARSPRDLAESLAEARRTLPDAVVDRPSRSIPPSLRAILAKCLAPDPADRYARGNELAEDLDRWRSLRPLAFADEPRSSRLTRKARKGRRHLIAGALTLATALVVGAFASALIRGNLGRQADSKYAAILDRPDSGAFGFRWDGLMKADGDDNPLDLAIRQLARYDVLDDPDWRDRDDIRTLPDPKREELEAWLFEQILRYAMAQGAYPDSPENWKRGLALLDRTLSRVRSEALRAGREPLLALLGRADDGPFVAGRAPLPRWLDEYLAGVAAEPLHAREAMRHYQAVLEERPGLFWGHFRAAVTASRINEYESAARHLRACVERSPANPTLRLNLAQVLFHAEADAMTPARTPTFTTPLAECDRAQAIDPDFLPVYRVRAHIRQSSGMTEGVRDDLNRHRLLTTRQGTVPGLVLRMGLLLKPGPNYDSPATAIESYADRILEADPDNRESRAKRAVSLARLGRSRESIEEYDRLLVDEPSHLLFRYQRASVLDRFKDPEALREYAALIDHPRFEEILPQQPGALRAFHYVATDLLNQGRLDEALAVARRSLIPLHQSRSLDLETLVAHRIGRTSPSFSPEGETYYLLARIHAQAVREHPDRIDQVVDCLERAFAADPVFRRKWFANDKLFDGVRVAVCERVKSDGDR